MILRLGTRLVLVHDEAMMKISRCLRVPATKARRILIGYYGGPHIAITERSERLPIPDTRIAPTGMDEERAYSHIC